MGILGTILGSNLAQPVEAVGKVLDVLFTSDDERLGRDEAKARLAQQPMIAQTEINKIEASHRSIFVAGWRPFIGWVCGFGLFFSFIINPCIQWVTNESGPVLPLSIIGDLVTALLGLGTLRTFEKIGGRAK